MWYHDLTPKRERNTRSFDAGATWQSAAGGQLGSTGHWGQQDDHISVSSSSTGVDADMRPWMRQRPSNASHPSMWDASKDLSSSSR